MPVMYHVTSVWSGIQGAPGYTNWYFETTDPLAAGAAAATTKAVNAWSAASVSLPLGASIKVNPDVEVIDDVTGNLESIINVSPAPTTVTGGGASEYAGPAGMVINWRTNGLAPAIGGDGGLRRVRGRTFFVPCGKDAFLAGGTLRGADTARMIAMANALLGAGPAFGIYARHVPAKTTPPTHPERNGSFHPVTAFNVPGEAAVLRSRRD